MESNIYPIFMFFLVFILPFGIGLIVVLAIRGLPPSRRNNDTAVQMDSSSYIKTNDGNLIIKRRKFHIWLIVIILGILEIILTASIISDIFNIIKGEGSSIALKLEDFLGYFVIGYILFRSIQALRQPSIIQFNTNSKILKVRKGLSQEQINFSQVSTIINVKHSTPRHGLRKVELQLILANGNMLELGSISREKDIPYAYVIVQQIADATSANVKDAFELPYGQIK